MKCPACRAAFVLGCIAGGVYIGCSRALLSLRIDDPLDASAVHAGCAIVGLLGEREPQGVGEGFRHIPEGVLHERCQPAAVSTCATHLSSWHACMGLCGGAVLP